MDVTVMGLKDRHRAGRQPMRAMTEEKIEKIPKMPDDYRVCHEPYESHGF